MPPLIKQDNATKPNLRCYFKRSINKFKFPLTKVANLFKTTFGLNKVRKLASNSWNIFNNNTIIEDDEINLDEEYIDIYTKLLLKLQTCGNIQQTNYFIQQMEKNDSARYYAGYLWDFKLICEAEENECLDDFFNKYMAKAILKMTNQDLITTKKLIMGYCKDVLPEISDDIKPSNLTFYLLEQVMEKKYRDVLIGLINLWFLKTPLLNEIAKHVTWNFLNDINACLLNVNDLYEVFINQCYKNWQK